ncbi:MAG: ribonuclease III, partial [Desulfovibrionaceae bacterium]|nr:ribonuclease III [Desulfovibrionaceae bacterium]
SLELPDAQIFTAKEKSIKKAQQLCALQALEYLRERYE